MNTHTIITIGRQYGSGGRYVARLLAEKLNIPFYDKEILTEASRDSGICREVLEENDEKANRSLLFSFVTGIQTRNDIGAFAVDMPLNHKTFLAQFDAIRKIADQGPCVIVGRCADYVLRDHSNVINAFIFSDADDKVHRVIEHYGVDPAKAQDVIKKADKQRASYYNYYCTGTWGAVDNYDICINTGKIGVENAADVLYEYVKIREAAQKAEE